MKKLIAVIAVVFTLSLLFSFQNYAATTIQPGVTLKIAPKYNLLACDLNSKTLFAYFNSSPRWLVKSTDGGKNWSTAALDDGLNGKTLVALEMSPEYVTDQTLFGASTSTLYQSTDGGETFDEITIKGLTGSITSLAAGPGGRVVLGTRTGSSGGGVLYMDNGWTDLQIGEKDVYAVAFDPNYESNRSLFACTYDGKTVRLEGNSGASQWYSGTLFTGTSLALQSAAIESPSDGAAVFVGLNGAGSGSDLYKVSSSALRGQYSVIDLNVNGSRTGCDVQSVAMLGTLTSGHLAAGQADSNIVRYTSNAGASTVTWNDSSAPPSGTGNVVLAYGQTYAALKSVPLAAPGTYYGLFAVTTGTGFEVARSMDYGDTFSSIYVPDMTGPTTTPTSTSTTTSNTTTSTSTSTTTSSTTTSTSASTTTSSTPTSTTTSTFSSTKTTSTTGTSTTPATSPTSTTTTYSTGDLTQGGPLFTINGLTVSKNQASPGETVEVAAAISNIGNQSGSYQAQLTVNGKVEDTQNITVAAGSIYTAKFNFTRNEAAIYNLQVGDKTATVSVVKSSTPPWWGFLIGIIILLVIILILIKILHWGFKK
jgi:hypothetical protein